MNESNVRLYQVVEKANPERMLELKGLAVKEREFVISTISTSGAWEVERKTKDASDARNKFDFQPENTKTEQDIKDHFQDLLGDTLFIYDAVKGIKLTDLVASLLVTPATPSTAQDTTVQFDAAILPVEAQQDVIWSIDAQAGLSIDQNGLVTVGAAVPLADYTVTATSKYNSAISGTATLTVA